MTQHTQEPGRTEGNDYLWDRSGTPDPEVQRLESKLERFRYSGATLPEGAAARVRRNAWFGVRGLVAAAAAAITLTVGLWLSSGPSRAGRCSVEPLAGEPLIGDVALTAERALGPDEWVRTAADAKARINISDLGWIDVDPQSRIRLVRSGPAAGGSEEHRLELSRGLIDVFVSAPPRVFFVDTPAATAVDYGCEYVLETTEDGAGLLSVRTGLVKLVRRHGAGQREASVYAGMSCRILSGSGPATPYRDRATEQFRTDLASLDDALASADPSGTRVSESLERVLASATKADSITLWHLLPRVDGDLRGTLFDSLAAFVPPPAGVTKERIMILDERALNMWSFGSFKTRG